MAIKAIIFDYDGIIRHLDSHKAQITCESRGLDFHQLMSSLWSIEPSKKLIAGLIDRKTWWEGVQRELPSFKNIEQSFIWEDLFSHSTIDQEVVDYIGNLHQNYTTAILSNAEKISKQNFYDEIDPSKFDHILASSDFGTRKPELEIYQKALEIIGTEPGETIFFDDQKKNVTGAKDVGIHAFYYENLNQMKSIIDDLTS